MNQPLVFSPTVVHITYLGRSSNYLKLPVIVSNYSFAGLVGSMTITQLYEGQKGFFHAWFAVVGVQ